MVMWVSSQVLINFSDQTRIGYLLTKKLVIFFVLTAPMGRHGGNLSLPFPENAKVGGYGFLIIFLPHTSNRTSF